jgi:SAM-dependent methyltransferase
MTLAERTSFPSAVERGQDVDSSQATYYTHVRTEIAPLLPASAKRILDLGAGAGATSKWLRTIYPAAEIVAVEGNETAAHKLKAYADTVHFGDINTTNSYLGNYDLVLCLDILEHLVNPEIVLKKITQNLTNGATVIISLPNVAHLSVSIPLLFLGRFDYADEGILDRTHLHFYTRKSALALARHVGLTPSAGVLTGLNHPVAIALNLLTLGFLRNSLLPFQFVFACQKLSRAQEPAIRWKRAPLKRRPATT